MSQPYQAPGYQGPLFQIRVLKHTGMVLAWQQQSVVITGTLEQCEMAYREAQQHCLLAGWWSPASALVFNWIAIFSNVGAIKRVRDLAQNPQAQLQQAHFQQGGPPPAWYPDPSGQPGQRYWDGTKWTHFTHPPAHVR